MDILLEDLGRLKKTKLPYSQEPTYQSLKTICNFHQLPGLYASFSLLYTRTVYTEVSFILQTSGRLHLSSQTPDSSIMSALSLNQLVSQFSQKFISSNSNAVVEVTTEDALPTEVKTSSEVEEQQLHHKALVDREEVWELMIRWWAPVVAVCLSYLIKCLIIFVRRVWVFRRRGQTLRSSILDATGWESLGKEILFVPVLVHFVPQSFQSIKQFFVMDLLFMYFVECKKSLPVIVEKMV